ncbi:Peptidase C69 [Gracilaria domingensis]|nr:Peptidase C69 [Gracilaria domingensis]
MSASRRLPSAAQSNAARTVCCRVLLFVFGVLSCISHTTACTATIFGRLSTADESTYTGGSVDCSGCDFRLAKVPARDHPPNSTRPIFLMQDAYPHVISHDRALTWHPLNLQGSPSQLQTWERSQPIGKIPQVPHTFAMFEGGAGYGIINEHGVSMSESTCPGRFVAKPRTQGGHALFDIASLSQVALERSTTAREAIKIMGQLSEQYGYYGGYWDDEHDMFNEAGESLMVADRRESWVFHVTPDDTGRSSVWAAQRVPDSDMTVVANSFIIRAIDSTSDDFMYSTNLYETALRNGLWKPGTRLDFSQAFSSQTHPPHSSYSNLRVWRLFTLANPDLVGVLNPHPNTRLDGYPFSVTPKSRLNRENIFRMYRDHFEGTPFDLTAGEAGGPYGDPNRYDIAYDGNMSRARARSGEFGRAVSLFRTSYTTISRSNPNLPREVGSMMYYSQQQPSSSVFVPLYVSVQSIPKVFSRGSLFRYENESMFWAVALVSNWVHRYYKHALDDLRALQNEIESYRVEEVDVEASALLQEGEKREAISLLRNYSETLSSISKARYSEFFWQLVARFHDGYVMQDANAPKVEMKSVFYPEWWLRNVGYFSARETGGTYDSSFERDLKQREFYILRPLPWSVLAFFSGVVVGSFLSVCFYVLGCSGLKGSSRRGYHRI